MRYHTTERVGEANAESLREHVFYVSSFIFEQVTQSIEQDRVEVLQIVERASLAHELLVDNHWELDVEYDVVVDSETQENSDQSELSVGLERNLVEPHELGFTVQDKHAVVGVENLVDDQLEEFFGNAALVNPLKIMESSRNGILRRILFLLQVKGFSYKNFNSFSVREMEKKKNMQSIVHAIIFTTGNNLFDEMRTRNFWNIMI